MKMNNSVELMLDARASLGEGSLWHPRKNILLWVDILEQEVHFFDPKSREDRVIKVGQYVGTVVPRMSGGLMLALHHGFASLDPETEELKMIHDPESHLPNTRFNDGKCDPAGRFWAGTLDLNDKPEICSLYCMDTNLEVRRMLDKIGNSNGIVWNLNHSIMYYIDTPTRQVAAFDYAIATGDISNRRAAIMIPEEMGYPDGMTIDAEGMLWIALWGGGGVSRWDPSRGKLLDSIQLPVTQVTSCAFGGPDLTDLYITSARFMLDDQELKKQPLAGGLFRAIPGVRGLPTYEFKG